MDDRIQGLIKSRTYWQQALERHGLVEGYVQSLKWIESELHRIYLELMQR